MIFDGNCENSTLFFVYSSFFVCPFVLNVAWILASLQYHFQLQDSVHICCGLQRHVPEGRCWNTWLLMKLEDSFDFVGQHCNFLRPWWLWFLNRSQRPKHKWNLQFCTILFTVSIYISISNSTWHPFYYFATVEAGINLENDGRCLTVRSGVQLFKFLFAVTFWWANTSKLCPRYEIKILMPAPYVIVVVRRNSHERFEIRSRKKQFCIWIVRIVISSGLRPWHLFCPITPTSRCKPLRRCFDILTLKALF